MSDRTRRLCAALALLVAAGWVWSGVYASPNVWALLGLSALAIAPALRGWRGRPLPWWLTGGITALAMLGCAALASRQSPLSLAMFDASAWDTVGRIIRDGFVESNQAVAPVARDAAPAFTGLLDVLWALQAASVAGAVVVRGRPAVAIATLSAGCAYRWTVAPPAHPVWEGVAMVAAIVAALTLARPPQGRGLAARGPRGAAVMGIAALAAAAVVGVAGVLPENGARWWNWESWGAQGGPGTQVGTLSTAQNYGQLQWPENPRAVMSVDTPRPLPMAAAVLSGFDGASFVDAPMYGIPEPSMSVTMLGGYGFVTERTPNDPDPVVQNVHLERTITNLIFAGGRVTLIRGRFPGSVTLINRRTLATSPPSGPDFGYQVTVVVPDPDPAKLRAAAEYHTPAPEGTTLIRPFVGTNDTTGTTGEPYAMPLWPQGRDVVLSSSTLGTYTQVRELAQRVVGDARTPYVAVNRIETHLRQTYAYDEQPPSPSGVAPLEAFLFTTKRGFCQHFAGSMALMLRSVGIPSRVVVGYAPGKYNVRTKVWDIVDRDAHAWVEAYLPDAGWVAFDPTPGRYAPNRVSVGSPDYAPPRATGDTGEDVTRNPINVPKDAQPTRPRPTPAPVDPPETAAPVAASQGVPWWVWAGGAALVVVAGLALLPATRRGLGRALGRRRNDPRTRVFAAVRAFEDDVARLGYPAPQNLDASGRTRHVQASLGVDAARLYGIAERARYAAGDTEPEAAAEAWQEVRRLRRDVRPAMGRGRRVRAYLGMRPRPPRSKSREPRPATRRRTPPAGRARR